MSIDKVFLSTRLLLLRRGREREAFMFTGIAGREWQVALTLK